MPWTREPLDHRSAAILRKDRTDICGRCTTPKPLSGLPAGPAGGGFTTLGTRLPVLTLAPSLEAPGGQGKGQILAHIVHQPARPEVLRFHLRHMVRGHNECIEHNECIQAQGNASGLARAWAFDAHARIHSETARKQGTQAQTQMDTQNTQTRTRACARAHTHTPQHITPTTWAGSGLLQRALARV